LKISQLISETTSDAFVCSDASDRITFWNRAAEVMFGWSASEAIGATLALIIPQRFRAAHREGVNRLNGGAQAKLVGKTVEVPAQRRDGTLIQTELSLGMWNDHGSGVPAGFAAIIRDITSRKETEAQLDERIAAIEAANDGIAITDDTGNFTFMNSAHAEMFGYADAAEIVGSPWSTLYGPDETSRLLSDVFPALERDGVWIGEAIGVRVDGAIVEQELSLSARQGGQGIVCVTRDISGRRRVAREKALLREQMLLAQRQQAVGHLAAGIAHDFNNLIAAIATSAQVIANLADEGSIRHAARICSAADAAASLVEKMLSLGSKPANRQVCDLGKVVSSVADLLETSLKGQQRIVLELPDAPLEALADQSDVMQVLLNLALNARDALPQIGPATITMGIDLSPPSDVDQIIIGQAPTSPAARLYVRDTGRGIAAEHIDQIFEPYFTRKDQTGNGLGLSMVAGIISAVGGGIAVRSDVGAGTCFEVYWPLEPNGLNLGTITLGHLGVNNSLAGRTILIVDDDQAMVERLSQIFELAGAECAPCLNALDALAALREDPCAWGAMITDYDMPGINGAALARRARLVRPDLPILLCTALPNAPRPSEENELFDAITGKLVSPSKLIVAAQLAVHNREARSTS
jgi:PAS domain S-box-containing protein